MLRMLSRLHFSGDFSRFCLGPFLFFSFEHPLTPFLVFGVLPCVVFVLYKAVVDADAIAVTVAVAVAEQ